VVAFDRVARGAEAFALVTRLARGTPCPAATRLADLGVAHAIGCTEEALWALPTPARRPELGIAEAIDRTGQAGRARAPVGAPQGSAGDVRRKPAAARKEGDEQDCQESQRKAAGDDRHGPKLRKPAPSVTLVARGGCATPHPHVRAAGALPLR
jgi:hypothetical protein